MKAHRTLICALLVLCCLLPSAQAALFRDVPRDRWYYEPVTLACAEGLMDGTDTGVFEPLGTLSLAQAVTMAARAHSSYRRDGQVFDQSQGSHWWDTYEDYALAESIIGAGDFPDLSRAATRADMAYIFAHALPVEAFPAINTVEALPDISEGRGQGPEVYALYRAGVLEGDDKYGAFRPGDSITRCEAAAIITRVALPSERKSFSLTPVSVFSEYDYQNGGALLYTKLVSAESGGRYTESKYRADGTLWVRRLRGADGALLSKTVTHAYGSSVGKYDALGRLTETAEYDAEGALSMRTVYEYDAQGLLCGQRSYDSGGGLSTWYVFEYGQDGRLTRKFYYGVRDGLIYFWRYSYASESEWSCRQYKGDGTLFGSEKYICGGGRQLRAYVYQPDGTLRDWTENEYSGARLLRVRHYDGFGTLSYIEDHDADGDRLQHTYYDRYGQVTGTERYFMVIRMTEEKT